MRYLIISFILFNCTKQVNCQNWQPGNVPFSVKQLRVILPDTINNRIFFAGAIILDGSGNYNKNAICVFDGNNWTTIDTINGLIYSMVIYQNELIVGGSFTGVNGQNFPYLVKWDGNNWQHLGGNINSTVTKIRVVNNELVVTGYFSQIGNIAANHVAKWNGSTWSDLFNVPFMTGYVINDVSYFNNEWYIAGNFTMSNGVTDIAVYNNGWKTVGTIDTLQGGFTSISDLEIYKNELYASGYIYKSQGNVGNGIQRWNGTSWNSLNNSVQGWDNTFNSNAQINDICVSNGNLYVGGVFSYADNVPASRFAIWDGVKWCSTNDDFGGSVIQTIGVFQDTVWIGGADTINNICMNRVAKLPVNTSVDTCGILSISEFQNNSDQITLFPNPTTTEMFLEFNFIPLREYTISVFDCYGQYVYVEIQKNVNGQSRLFTGELPNGVYFIHYIDEKRSTAIKFIKQ